MQSDKHLNNMQELSNSQNLNNNSSLSASVPSATVPNSGADIRDSPKILLPNLQQQQQQNQQNQQQAQQQQQAQVRNSHQFYSWNYFSDRCRLSFASEA